MPACGQAMKLESMESILDLEDTLRILANGMAQLGDYAGALLLSAKFRAKELELKGVNMRQEERRRVLDRCSRFGFSWNINAVVC
jgi:hypothetical protein